MATARRGVQVMGGTQSGEGGPSRVLAAPGSRCSVNYSPHVLLRACVLTLAPASEGHRFPGGQAASINATFINRFLSLFDFKRELPATRQRAMGIDSAGRGRWPRPVGPSPGYPEGLGGGSGAVGCWAAAEGVTGSPRFPRQLMGPWRHQGGQEEW